MYNSFISNFEGLVYKLFPIDLMMLCFKQGQSVLWTWKGKDDESHNIIHVTSADSKVSFNSSFPTNLSEEKDLFLWYISSK